MPQITLNVPQLSESSQETFPLPSVLEGWIAKLPITSITQTAKLLYKIIKKTNRIKATPIARFQTTAILAQNIDQNAISLEKCYLDAAFPLSINIKHLAFIRVRLAEELAFAYKLIIQDLTQELSNAELKLLATAIFYAIQRLSDLIYARALVYQLPLNLVWSELHTLYKFAEKHRVTTINFKAALGANGEELEATTKDLYLRALIFAIASPMRLRQREICAVYFNILKWAKVIRVRSITNFTPSETSFIVQIQGDNPPQHSAIISHKLDGTALELDTGFLIQVVQDLHDTMPTEISGIVPGNKRDILTKSTLRRLIQSWGNAPQRYFTRTKLNFELPLAIGINAIYKLLTGQDIPSPEPILFGPKRFEPGTETMNLMQHEVEFNALDHERGRGLSLINNNEIDYLSLEDSEVNHADWSTQIEKPQKLDDSSSPYITLTTLNESVGGYCVDWSSSKAPGAKIGELIGIQIPGSPPTCTLAVVRWIHDALEHGLQAGLQVLSPKVEAVTIFNKKQRNLLPIHGLFIPELKNANLPPSLITAPSVFHTDDFATVLLLKQGKIERPIRIIELLDASGAFSHFSVSFQ